MNRTYQVILTALIGIGTSAGGQPSPRPKVQDFSPPAPVSVDEAALAKIEAAAKNLAKAIESLRRKGVADDLLAEVEIYHKAAVWIVRHDEFYQKEFPAWTLEVLQDGLKRAGQLAKGESPWRSVTGRDVVRAYRSRVDGSVQPFAITFPTDYGKDTKKRWRLDVVLHGRDRRLTEVKFLHVHNGANPAPAAGFVRLDIYGRLNIAYRWAGETDVFEAIEAFLAGERRRGRDRLIDRRRVVLRGFSMGGAGTWHLGLHHPSRWCVLGPGAGFTRTHGYVKNLPKMLPGYQEKCLHIYDAVDYAENAFDAPVVAFGGTKDPQLQAAVNIQERLKPLGIPMKFIIAPGLGHRFPLEWRKKAEVEYARFATPGRQTYPARIRFVTYTLKYPASDWVEILHLDRHYQQARVEAIVTNSGYKVDTRNVAALRLKLIEGNELKQLIVRIDGQSLNVRPFDDGDGESICLVRRDGKWYETLLAKLAVAAVRMPRKSRMLHGPIDDAFMDSFVCVRGTGKTWHPATQAHVEADLQRFAREWNKFLRGDLPVKKDTDVTAQDIAGKHLILFGDPSSNSLIAEVVDALPIQWNRKHIKFNGKEYASDSHLPAVIYPSPLNSKRYVVLNTGHTFHAAEFLGTNALLFPRLGDYAILKLGDQAKPLAVEPVVAGLFDEQWMPTRE